VGLFMSVKIEKLDSELFAVYVFNNKTSEWITAKYNGKETFDNIEEAEKLKSAIEESESTQKSFETK
jgi:hypothetical protein